VSCAPGTPPLKVILLGEASVGKTSILSRILNSTFPDDPQSTVQRSYYMKTFTVQGAQVQVSLWDTAGQERYRALVRSYSRQAAAALIVFDASEKLDCESLEPWIHSVHLESPDALICIVGNKCDLPFAVKQRDVHGWAERAGFMCSFVSALTGDGIADLFDGVVSAIAAPTRTVLVPEGIEFTRESWERSCC
jgi:small GTP-binding protein